MTEDRTSPGFTVLHFVYIVFVKVLLDSYGRSQFSPLTQVSLQVLGYSGCCRYIYTVGLQCTSFELMTMVTAVAAASADGR